MATSYDAHGPDTHLRLTLAASLHAGPLSGGWWPHTRDLRWEAQLLLEQFPRRHGRILRLVVSSDDWDGTPRQVPGPSGPVEVGLFPGDDRDVAVLGLATGVRLRLRVVDAELDPDRASELMLASCEPRGGRMASRGQAFPRRRVAGS